MSNTNVETAMKVTLFEERKTEWKNANTQVECACTLVRIEEEAILYLSARKWTRDGEGNSYKSAGESKHKFFMDVAHPGVCTDAQRIRTAVAEFDIFVARGGMIDE